MVRTCTQVLHFTYMHATEVYRHYLIFGPIQTSEGPLRIQNSPREMNSSCKMNYHVSLLHDKSPAGAAVTLIC